MTYFQFLYGFCYKPFLSDRVGAKGLFYQPNPNRFIRQDEARYYITSGGYLYSNRVALLLEKMNTVSYIKQRLEKYYDEFIIDEVQDIAGRDFTLLESLMEASINMLFVGDFYQHTFDTSRDGVVNKNLHAKRQEYEKRFQNKGFSVDNTTLIKSHRCSKSVCDFISRYLGIQISSSRALDDDTEIRLISDQKEIDTILSDDGIIKLHYKESYKYGIGRRNWGETKGEDCYRDVCVVLNKTTSELYKKGKLCELKIPTRNKLYVEITRAHGNVYFVTE